MTREFHQWMAYQANSIEDTSEFVKPIVSYELSTDAQKRMLFANHLVPNTTTAGLVKDWLRVFCSRLDSVNTISNREVVSELLWRVIGMDEYIAYNRLDTDHSISLWLAKLKNKIARGEFK